MGVVIVDKEGAVLWVNLGRPIVTNGAFATRSSQTTLRTCYETRLLSVRRQPCQLKGTRLYREGCSRVVKILLEQMLTRLCAIDLEKGRIADRRYTPTVAVIWIYFAHLLRRMHSSVACASSQTMSSLQQAATCSPHILLSPCKLELM